MLVIPAIDVRGGKCVRLRQGDFAQETVFGDDPAATARRWVDQGAEMLHLVDLDGAREGRPVNLAAIEAVVRRAGVPCQLGGGLRTEDDVRRVLDLGVARAIVGTQAVRNPEWFSDLARRLPGKLALGLDARDGMAATEGWLEGSSVSAVELAARFRDAPLAAVVYTDIAKDGMMAGPNFDATEQLARSMPIPVVASGGVATEEDVLELQRRGIGACILGRTIYEGVIQIPKLLSRLRARPMH
jgi:phosphoribosylformimino-5-aminoimidazole carboxamide ribotide isomerase